MSSQSFGHLISARRHELGLTQVRLAQLLGVAPGTLRNWERGRATPTSDDTMTALAAVLGIGEKDIADEGAFSADPNHPDESTPDDGEALDVSPGPPPGNATTDDPVAGDDAIASWETGTPKRGRRLRVEESEDPVEDSGSPFLGKANPAAAMLSGLKESEIVSTLRESETLSALKDSEILSGLRQRIANTFAPTESDTDDSGEMSDPSWSEDLGMGGRHGSASHSLTEDAYYEPSYVEDPDEMDHYRHRWIITAFVVIVLLMVAFWAMGQAQASLADGWQRMFDMLRI